MKPFDIVCKEIDLYPQSLFFKRPDLTKLSLAITTDCTNTCAHCANATQKKATLSFETITRLLLEGRLNKVKQIILWGGEPFLHKEIFVIIKTVLQLGFNLNIITNGFWGKTYADAEKVIETIYKDTANRRVSVVLSCDMFHQCNPATPLEKIAHIISVYLNKYHDSNTLKITIKYTAIPQDTTLQKLCTILYKSFPEDIINEFMQQHVRGHALDCSVGRAQQLTIPLTETTMAQKMHLAFQETFIDKFHLFISAQGTACVQQNTVGEELLSFGNIYTQSLSNICNDIAHNKCALFLCSNPFQHFLLPFRKYINLSGLLLKTHTYRELLVCLYKVENCDFDKREELESARRILTNANATQLDYAQAKETIYLYGDITDVFTYNLNEKDFKL